MEDVPVTLDDGELWLPSDIFPPSDQEPRHHHGRSFFRGGASLEDLNSQFSNINLAEQHRIVTPKVPPISKLFGPMAQYALTAPPSNALTVGPTVDCGLRNFRTGSGFAAPEPAIHRTMHKPVHCQADVELSLMETRIARPKSITINRSVFENRPHNRVFPFQESSFKCGCFMTNYRGSTTNYRGSTTGTGVFIPRTATASTRTTTFDGGKKHAGMSLHKDPARRAGIGRAKEFSCPHQAPQIPPSDHVGLPKDWTY